MPPKSKKIKTGHANYQKKIEKAKIHETAVLINDPGNLANDLNDLNESFNSLNVNNSSCFTENTIKKFKNVGTQTSDFGTSHVLSDVHLNFTM